MQNLKPLKRSYFSDEWQLCTTKVGYSRFYCLTNWFKTVEFRNQVEIYRRWTATSSAMIAPFIRCFLVPIRDLLSYVYFLPANSPDKCLTFLFMIWLSQLTQQSLIIVHDTFNAMETLERVITRIIKKSMIFLDLIFFSRWLQSQAGFRHCTEQWILLFFWLKIIIEVGTRISSYLINGFSQVEFQYTVLGKNSSWFMRDKWSWPIVQLYNNLLERKSSVI